jgi:UDP-N-acetylglucosamine 2-epimerase
VACANLVGANTDQIILNFDLLVENKELYQQMSEAVSPYGGVPSAKKIVEIICKIAMSKFLVDYV